MVDFNTQAGMGPPQFLKVTISMGLSIGIGRFRIGVGRRGLYGSAGVGPLSYSTRLGGRSARRPRTQRTTRCVAITNAGHQCTKMAYPGLNRCGVHGGNAATLQAAYAAQAEQHRKAIRDQRRAQVHQWADDIKTFTEREQPKLRVVQTWYEQFLFFRDEYEGSTAVLVGA
jgi:hypothetical protein